MFRTKRSRTSPLPQICSEPGSGPHHGNRGFTTTVYFRIRNTLILPGGNTMSSNIFTGTIPALMTPCTAERKPDFDALVRKGTQLIETGMSAVVYCVRSEERRVGKECVGTCSSRGSL